MYSCMTTLRQEDVSLLVEQRPRGPASDMAMLETSLEEKDGNRSAGWRRSLLAGAACRLGQPISRWRLSLSFSCRRKPARWLPPLTWRAACRTVIALFLGHEFFPSSPVTLTHPEKDGEFKRVGLRWFRGHRSIPQVFSNGRCLVGEVAVWRCPAHCPWDICVWKAIAPPPGYPIPDNCLVVSAEGLANSRMAGGAGLGSHRRSNRS